MGAILRTVLVLILALAFVGCAGLKNQESSSCRKMLADVHQDLVQCRSENIELAKSREQLDVIKKEEQTGITRLQKENLALSLQVKELQDQLNRSRKDAAVAAVEKKVAAQSAAEPAKASAPAAAKSKNRIKVLYGNGKPGSARKLAAKLTNLGYKVDKTGSAARSNYRHNMIYYARDAKPAAQRLAKQLKAEPRPLTWKSEYNLIVVAGGK